MAVRFVVQKSSVFKSDVSIADVASPYLLALWPYLQILPLVLAQKSALCEIAQAVLLIKDPS